MTEQAEAILPDPVAAPMQLDTPGVDGALVPATNTEQDILDGNAYRVLLREAGL